MQKRLSVEEKRAAVEELSQTDRPLSRIINMKDPRAGDVPPNDHDSESLRATSRRRAAKLIRRQRKPR